MKNSVIKLEDFKNGCKYAEHDLVQRYWPRVVRAATRLIKNGQMPLADGDDVAISVFNVLCRENENGKYNSRHLRNHDELWTYLLTILKRRVIDKARKRDSLKRGGDLIVPLAKLIGSSLDFDPAVVSTTPLQKAIEIERETRFWTALELEDIRQTVILRLEGKKLKEIGQAIGVTERTVRRLLVRARQIWKRISEEGI